jgi:23S rRNA (pseudouridine1915-N3)-methyltransferase
MKITLLVIGQTEQPFLKSGIDEYQKRINHYIPFELKIIPDIKNSKNLAEEIQKSKEGELILNHLNSSSAMVLFDEKGQSLTSAGFSVFLQKKMVSGLKELVFVIGGPYGFSDKVNNLVSEKISISKMTFPHQMVRLIIVEQIYRALTILKGEPYHHD